MHLTVFFIPEFDWFLYNDESSNIIKYQMNRNKFLMKRIHLVEKIKESNTIGILIGTLGIKNYLQAIDRIKKLILKKGDDELKIFRQNKFFFFSSHSFRMKF